MLKQLRKFKFQSQSLPNISHQIMAGTTWHVRKQPATHKFAYPYRYWGINLTALSTQNYQRGESLPTVKGLFGKKQMALHEFRPSDYLTLDSTLKCNAPKARFYLKRRSKA